MDYTIRRLLLINTIFMFLIGQQSNDVYYVRYFENDHNLRADLSMLSTSRRGKAHLAVSYDEFDHPVKIERVSASGIVLKREMLKYDRSGSLLERGEYTENW